MYKVKIKGTVILLAALLLFSLTAAETRAFADSEPPVLTSIAFDNAEIDGGFSPDRLSYTVTLGDSSVTPSLKSYDIDGEGELFVTYAYDDLGVQTGIVATLNYENGSVIYTFEYANPVSVSPSSDNYLTDIYCSLGEISPKINTEETKYTLYIPADLTELDLTPVTRDTNASCPPIELNLSREQTPEIALVCTASDGSEREYILEIKRVDKTSEQVRVEMAREGYVTFVEEDTIYDHPELFVLLACALAGVLLLLVIRKIACRVTAVAYDEKEKPFYIE